MLSNHLQRVDILNHLIGNATIKQARLLDVLSGALRFGRRGGGYV